MWKACFGLPKSKTMRGLTHLSQIFSVQYTGCANSFFKKDMKNVQLYCFMTFSTAVDTLGLCLKHELHDNTWYKQWFVKVRRGYLASCSTWHRGQCTLDLQCCTTLRNNGNRPNPGASNKTWLAMRLTPLTPDFRRPPQEDHEFKASLGVYRQPTTNTHHLGSQPCG